MRSCLMHQRPCRSQNLRISTIIFLGVSAPLDCHRRLRMRGAWLRNSIRFLRADADGRQLAEYSSLFRKSKLASLGGSRGESLKLIWDIKAGRTKAPRSNLLTNLSVYSG